MEDLEWRWMIGFLHGYGECVWQQGGDHLRRITRVIPIPNTGQLVMQKALLCVASVDPEPVFRVEHLVVISRQCSNDLMADVDRVWSGAKIQPANGTMIHNFKR